ncbi:kinetochore protein fta4 [Apiospora arundinis]
MAPPTILAHKSAFLTAQTLRLSQNLAPSGAWRNHVFNQEEDAAEQEDGQRAAVVTEKAVDDALYRLNHALQQHARRVYAPQATRHVAEQIDQLFLDINKDDRHQADVEDEQDEDGQSIQKGDELRQGADFSNLRSHHIRPPPTWDHLDPQETQSRPAEAAHYADLQARLGALSARRAETRARVERLRAMQNLLQPFRGEADGEDDEGSQNKKLQENLVSRNGEMEKELERMRMLLVRVAGRVGQLPAQNTTDEEGDTNMMGDLDRAERAKVQNLLDSF